jgi:RNA polymerase sporulation-specific sigma factor
MSNIDQMTELIREAKKGDREAAERLVKENSGLIWSVARRFFGRGVEADDLYQLGCLGFLKAIEGYDESYGTRFSTYAVPKIGGEIRRFLRDDGMIKVSRSTKERANMIRHARERLIQQLGREPYLSELSEETGITPEDIAAAETATETPDSLQRENSDGGFTLESALGVDGMEDDVIESLALREAISLLSEKEQMLIALRFYRGMTQDKTARILGV